MKTQIETLKEQIEALETKCEEARKQIKDSNDSGDNSLALLTDLIRHSKDFCINNFQIFGTQADNLVINIIFEDRQLLQVYAKVENIKVL